MTVIDAMESVAEWLRAEVCPSITLKVPDNLRQADKYDYRLANPSVHLMYVPPAKLAASPATDICPGILVHLLDGEDRPREHAAEMRLKLTCCIWNPGQHPEDVFGGPEEAAGFVATADGWRDAWNLVDLMVRKLRNAEHIGEGLRIEAEKGIGYGMYKEDGAVIDFYPFYFAEVEFSVETSEAPPSRYNSEDYL